MHAVAKRYTVLLLATLFFLSDDASAAEPIPVIVRVQGEGRIRVEVAAGRSDT